MCSIPGGAVGALEVIRLLAMPLSTCLSLCLLAANLGLMLGPLNLLNIKHNFRR